MTGKNDRTLTPVKLDVVTAAELGEVRAWYPDAHKTALDPLERILAGSFSCAHDRASQVRWSLIRRFAALPQPDRPAGGIAMNGASGRAA